MPFSLEAILSLKVTLSRRCSQSTEQRNTIRGTFLFSWSNPFLEGSFPNKDTDQACYRAHRETSFGRERQPSLPWSYLFVEDSLSNEDTDFEQYVVSSETISKSSDASLKQSFDWSYVSLKDITFALKLSCPMKIRAKKSMSLSKCPLHAMLYSVCCIVHLPSQQVHLLHNSFVAAKPTQYWDDESIYCLIWICVQLVRSEERYVH